MEINEFPHIVYIADNNIDSSEFPEELIKEIKDFKFLYGHYKKNTTDGRLKTLKTKSAVIMDQIITWEERDINEETPNQNQPDMTTQEQAEKDALTARAKEVNLPETASLQEIEAAEKAVSDAAAAKKAAEDAEAAAVAEANKQALIARAKQVNLPETATEAEIVAAEELAKNPPAESTLKKILKRDGGRIYIDELKKLMGITTHPGDEVTHEGVVLYRSVAYYYEKGAQ